VEKKRRLEKMCKRVPYSVAAEHIRSLPRLRNPESISVGVRNDGNNCFVLYSNGSGAQQRMPITPEMYESLINHGKKRRKNKGRSRKSK
jgi:hypothetical protein